MYVLVLMVFKYKNLSIILFKKKTSKTSNFFEILLSQTSKKNRTSFPL